MMKSKSESLDEYEKMSENCDCAWLLTAIKGITHRFEGTRYVFLSLDEARTNFYSYKQKKSETLHEYLRHLHVPLIDSSKKQLTTPRNSSFAA